MSEGVTVQKLNLLLAPVIFVLSACGGDKPPPKASEATPGGDSTQADTTTHDEAATTSAKTTARQRGARNGAEAVEETSDLDMRGRFAAKSLSELDILPAEQTRALEAASAQEDPGSCDVILRYGFLSAAEKRCNIPALRVALNDGPAAKKAMAAIRECKITGVNEKEASELAPWAVIASAIVLDELGRDPASSDDEKKLARALVNACRRR